MEEEDAVIELFAAAPGRHDVVAARALGLVLRPRVLDPVLQPQPRQRDLGDLTARRKGGVEALLALLVATVRRPRYDGAR